MTGGGGTHGPDERAVSKAHLVPAVDFLGTVHSVFASACNIAVGDLLITVQDAGRQHVPTSVRVCAMGSGSWSPAVRAGDRASHQAGVLAFGRHVLDLSRVPVWAPGPTAGWTQPQAARRRLAQLAGIRRTHVRMHAHPATPELDRDVRALTVLLPGALTPEPRAPMDGSGLDSVVRRLVGAGAGLTPAGDDVLVGLLAALLRAGRGVSPAATAFDWIGAVAERYAHRTTDISAHYLRLAARGHVSEPLSALIDAVVSDSPTETLRGRANDVLDVGASSGADALLGVLIGLDAVLDLPLTEQIHEKVA